MTKGVKIGIIVAIVISLVVVFMYITPNNGGFKKRINENNLPLAQQKQSKKGLYILHRLMKTYPKVVSLKNIKNPIDSSLKTYSDYASIYFLIDKKIKLSNSAKDSLFNFVKKGNSAFVSVKNFGMNFYSEFCATGFIKTAEGDSIDLILNHTNLKLENQYFLKIIRNGEIKTHTWNYINLTRFYTDREDITILSESGIEYINEPIFIKIPVGKGYFYIHSIPETFYNESMFTENGFDYAQSVLSNLPKGHYLWHNHTNKYNPLDDFNPNSSYQDDSSIKRESPIQYILRDENLRAAYLLLLATLFVYIVFKSKRKQKIIPATEPNENSSLEFVNTVSKLYLNQNKHYKFMVHYEQSFLNFIKTKYYISSSKIDENYLNSVALKSDITKEKIKEIFTTLDKAKKSYNFTSEQLIELHKKVEYFYKNCK